MKLGKVAELSTSIIEKYRTDMVETVTHLTRGGRYAFQNGVPDDIHEFGTMTVRTVVALGYAYDHYFAKYKKSDGRHGQ